jgi:hypothetical protein
MMIYMMNIKRWMKKKYRVTVLRYTSRREWINSNAKGLEEYDKIFSQDDDVKSSIINYISYILES